jgi:Cdc6-like AAA superfamily ATPase
MSTTPTEARLRNDWDATITYDVLDRPDEPPGVFVGREDLLRPLESAVVEADKRGTILVSGYRGSGKTTLVIEALRRAALAFRNQNQPEPQQPRLLPVVLNVSEVSTSLAAPESDTKLQIDPRRLLIALLRAFRQRIDRFGADDPLRRRIDLLYSKATAAAFKLAQSSGRSRESVRQEETSVKIDSAELLKGSLFPAGLISLGLASLGAADSVVDQLVKGIAATGAVGAATAGVALNRSRSRKEAETEEIALTYERDNSQQELENDLKDLLQSLREKRWRTVIVLEELDKLDGEGEQLDGVIRYFKNLFTQAPALFVFVTDKAYYDRISRNIRHARRERSYAVEHTFFTHRMFVGRPTTRDCLEFVRRLLPDAADQEVVAGIYAPDSRWATESFGARHAQAGAVAAPLSLFVRVLLFRASNHLFDLKAELQRFVRTTAQGPSLEFGAEMFPPEDQMLAKFQDLIVDKVRTFAIKGGRRYANEVLHDCLYGVFHDLGSSGQRQEHELLVTDTPDERDGPLEPGERKRINDAVRSLLDDLVRGGALRRTSPEGTPLMFEWQDKPAEAFSLVRKLEAHEQEYAGRLQQLSGRAKALQAFAPQAAFTAEATRLEQEFAARAAALSDLDTKVSVDDAKKSERDAGDAFRRLAAQANHAISTEASSLHALPFESLPLGSYEPGDGARLMVTADGDPRSGSKTGIGIVVLAEGAREGMLADVRALVERARPQRVAVVALDTPLGVDETAAWEAKWVAALGGLPAWREGMQLKPRVRVLGREQLGKFESAPQPDEVTTERLASLVLARELIGAAIWAVRPRPASGSSPHDGARFASAARAWLRVPAAEAKPILVVSPTLPQPRLAGAVSDALWFEEPEAPWCVPLLRLARTGTLENAPTRADLAATFLAPLLTPGAAGVDLAIRNRCVSRLFELLAGEAGIVITDAEPPGPDNVLEPLLGAHRWVMPDSGTMAGRIERHGSEDIKLDLVDQRTPRGSTFTVTATWGLLRDRPPPPSAAAEGPAQKMSS